MKAMLWRAGKVSTFGFLVLSAFIWTVFIKPSDSEARAWRMDGQLADHAGATSLEKLTQLSGRLDVETGGVTDWIGASAVASTSSAYCGTTFGHVVAAHRDGDAPTWNFLADGPIRNALALGERYIALGAMDGVLALQSYQDGAGQFFVDAGGAIGASPTIAHFGDHELVFAATTNGFVGCFSADTVATVWQASVGEAVWGAPTVDEARDRVYVADYDGRISAFRATTGVSAWSSDPAVIDLGPVRAPIALVGKRLYVATLASGLAVLQDDGSSVSLAWQPTFFTGSHTGSAAVLPGINGGFNRIVVASTGGLISCFDDLGPLGSLVWQVQLPGTAGVPGAPAIVDDQVFVGSDDGMLRSFDLASGAPRLSVATGGPVSGSLAVADGVVYLATENGHLEGFGNQLDAPLGLSAVAVGPRAVSLTWTPTMVSLPVSGYEVYRSVRPDGGLMAVGRAFGMGASTYVDVSVTTSGFYYYAITAAGELTGSPPEEESTWSEIVGVEVTLSLPRVIGLVATAGDGLVRTIWAASAGSSALEGIRLYRREAGGAAILLSVLPPGATGFLDYRVENRVGYTYEAEAFDAIQSGPRAVSLTATPLTDGWPMFQRDILHQGADPGSVLELPLGIAWSRTFPGVDGFPGDPVFGENQQPLVVSGTVFAVSTGGLVMAMRGGTGETLWTAHADGCISTPVLFDGKLYVSCDAGIRRFDAVSGSEDGDPWVGLGFGPANSSPVVYRGRLYVGRGKSLFVAIDIESGTVIWSAPTATQCAAAGFGCALYIDSDDFRVSALNADTGAPIWQFPVPAPPPPKGVPPPPRQVFLTVAGSYGLSPDIAVPALLVTSIDGTGAVTLYAIDALVGATLWSDLSGSGWVTAPSLAGSTVFTGGGCDNQVSARDVATGSLIWSAPTFTKSVSGCAATEVPGQPLVHTGVVIAGNQVWVADLSGDLFGFDAGTGALLDQPQLQSSLGPGYLVTGDGSLFAVGRDGTLYAFRPTNGPVIVRSRLEELRLPAYLLPH